MGPQRIAHFDGSVDDCIGGLGYLELNRRRTSRYASPEHARQGANLRFRHSPANPEAARRALLT